MKKIFGIVFIILFFVVHSAFAEGTIIVSSSRIKNSFTSQNKYLKVSLICTADSSDGSFPAKMLNSSTPGLPATGLIGLKLYKVLTYPGSTAPTGGASLTITQDTSDDLLGGGGSGLISATLYKSCLAGTSDGNKAEMPITGDISFNLTGNSVHSAVINAILLFEAID